MQYYPDLQHVRDVITYLCHAGQLMGICMCVYGVLQDTLLMALHPNARNILGDRNIAFLHGPEHKALRKSFLALFTRKALGVSCHTNKHQFHYRAAATANICMRAVVLPVQLCNRVCARVCVSLQVYVLKQDGIVCDRLREWLGEQGSTPASYGTATEMRPFVRDLNAWTSQEVFAGELATHTCTTHTHAHKHTCTAVHRVVVARYAADPRTCLMVCVCVCVT